MLYVWPWESQKAKKYVFLEINGVAVKKIQYQKSEFIRLIEQMQIRFWQYRGFSFSVLMPS